MEFDMCYNRDRCNSGFFTLEKDYLLAVLSFAVSTSRYHMIRNFVTIQVASYSQDSEIKGRTVGCV